MKAYATLLLTVATFAVVRADDRVCFYANAIAANSIPPIQNTEARGQLFLSVVPDNNTATYTATLTGLRNLTMGHLHYGNATSSGPVLVSILPLANLTASAPLPMLNPTLSFQGDVVTSARFTAASLAGPLANRTLDDLVDALGDGLVYVNYHTVANPGGLIRAQLMEAPCR